MFHFSLVDSKMGIDIISLPVLCTGYDTKLHLMERPQFWKSGDFEQPLFAIPHPTVQSDP